MEPLQLLISTSLDALLAQRAVKEGQTKADIVRAALESYLAPQPPLERSFQKVERTVNDRFDRLEKLMRQVVQENYGQRPLPPLSSPAPVPLQEIEEEDEPDEILPEFLEFASPAVQHHLEILS